MSTSPLPMGAVLDWTMGTPAGIAAYRDSRINGALKAILREWCEFLNTPAALYVLNDSPQGWKSVKACADVGMQFQHDPSHHHWGSTSWNDFFTRRFVDGARPVTAPDDDSVNVSACESMPYGLRTDVRLRDRFWVKGQPYSLHDMNDNDDAVAEFAGGTVNQAFLSATNYHRWHSPVAGTVVRAWVVDGTSYSEADIVGRGVSYAAGARVRGIRESWPHPGPSPHYPGRTSRHPVPPPAGLPVLGWEETDGPALGPHRVGRQSREVRTGSAGWFLDRDQIDLTLSELDVEYGWLGSDRDLGGSAET